MSASKQTRNRKHKPRSNFQRLARRFMSGLLRSLFFVHGSSRYGRAGFVLPTTVLLLLVVTLTAGALSFRAASRTQSTSMGRDQQIIENVAAPAADRAKAKLEYLFSRDVRFPGNNTPASDVLATLLLNQSSLELGITALPVNPYTLPDEIRLDINDDGTLDNAWSFPFDVNANGQIDDEESIVYSVLMDDSVDIAGTPDDVTDDLTLTATGESYTVEKANNLITRNGPINTSNIGANCGNGRAPAQGWQVVNQGILEKNFQITAYASNGKDLGRANSALELQQVRISQLGNTWGAWFRYDMELHPGPEFNWNGAIHTDGNLLITNNFRGHMISSHNSCLYTQNASAITMAEVDNDNDGSINVNDADSQDFQGQLIAGAPSYNNLNVRGNPQAHLFNGLGTRPITGGNDTKIVRERDSVAGQSYDDMLDIALDPVALFTQNVSRHRQTGTWQRDTNWDTRPMVTSGRITNENQNPPFLDDFNRADDRYGPRPAYANSNWVTDTDDGVINTNRDDDAYDKQLGDEILAGDPLAQSLTNATAGLDGYWERQSIINGLRVVIGQRLELGDHLGWNFDAAGGTTDPLYPPDTNIVNKQRQRVTLRDNLSAVQGMVVYQYETNNGQYPLACIANTAHPATLETIRASRTFNVFTNGAGDDVPLIDFFEGNGTNGWEFAFPDALDTEAEFAAALDTDEPLGIALRNMAYFAGDPNGGTPSFPPVQDDNVHPFPHQSMWGDYSVLRRIFDDRLDSGNWRSLTDPPQIVNMSARYDALSPADKSSLHSAACTLGLLAYNVDNVLTAAADGLSTGSALSDYALILPQLIDGASGDDIEDLITGAVAKTAWVDEEENTVLLDEDGNPLLDGATPICPTGTDAAGFQANCDAEEYYDQFSTEDWIEAYRLSAATTPTTADLQRIRDVIDDIRDGNQVIRDRSLGFQSGYLFGFDSLTGGNDNLTWSNVTGFTDLSQVGGEDVVVQTTCDPDIFNQIITDAFGAGGGGADGDLARVGLSMMVCSSATATPVKYPALYYLFPMVNHDHDGAPATGEVVAGTTISPTFEVSHAQPDTEEYIDRVDTYGENANVVYTVLEDGNNDDIENNGENGYADIAFVPGDVVPASWRLPSQAPAVIPIGGGAAGEINPESMDIKIINGANNVNVGLSMLDKVSYNGREEMAVRLLDIDLALLTQRRNGVGGDYWISDGQATDSGIFYAIREDAAREDSITRPVAMVGGNPVVWADCDELDEILTANRCWMQPNAPTDPPLSQRDDGSTAGLSIKPVDYAPDPDRRPYGFRLNANLNGNNGDLSDGTNRDWGFTFVTDNAAYLKGEFNPHTTNGNDTLEEFTQTLFNNAVGFGNPFYDNRTDIDNRFAAQDQDRWRVAEILADAVYLVSNNYVDGAVQEGFIRDRDEVSDDFQNSAGNDSRTSFHNQQRPLRENNNTWADASGWLRVDGNYADNGQPIWVNRNGVSRTDPDVVDRQYENAEDDTEFIRENERHENALIDAATPERMNATIISGLVPSRGRQGYGGLHNFPRFLENWNDQNLFIQGAFLQLNFSTAGTGPFDLDAWNPGEAVENNERIKYYKPPSRRWGYDVGLQFAPAGPIAQRFVVVGSPRSEHYRQLPVDDPYVRNLRCAQHDDNRDGTFEQVFSSESCS
ncbi:MAG: hormogonium polysaccharide biosynthesis protein HpsA [Cyanobacteria bacterium J06649_4]